MIVLWLSAQLFWAKTKTSCPCLWWHCGIHRTRSSFIRRLGKKWESDVCCCCWCQSSRGATVGVQQLRISLSAAAAPLGLAKVVAGKNRIFLTNYRQIIGFVNNFKWSKCLGYIIDVSASLSRSQWSAISLSRPFCEAQIVKPNTLPNLWDPPWFWALGYLICAFFLILPTRLKLWSDNYWCETAVNEMGSARLWKHCAIGPITATAIVLPPFPPKE